MDFRHSGKGVGGEVGREREGVVCWVYGWWEEDSAGCFGHDDDDVVVVTLLWNEKGFCGEDKAG